MELISSVSRTCSSGVTYYIVVLVYFSFPTYNPVSVNFECDLAAEYFQFEEIFVYVMCDGIMPSFAFRYLLDVGFDIN